MVAAAVGAVNRATTARLRIAGKVCGAWRGRMRNGYELKRRCEVRRVWRCHGAWTVAVELAYPGHAYPYRGRISVPPGDVLHGLAGPDLVRHAESLMLLGVVERDQVENVGAVDGCELDRATGAWDFSFPAGAFYEDIDWAFQNVQAMAGQFELLAANPLPGGRPRRR